VNKEVDGQRKRNPEKKYKGESRYRKSRNGKVKGQKKKKGRAIGKIITAVKLEIKKSDKKREKKDIWKKSSYRQ
jgi:hypothetical protein